MQNKNDKEVFLSRSGKTQEELQDSLRIAFEGDGVEDQTWDLIVFCLFPVATTIILLFPWTEWVLLVRNVSAIPKLIQAGVKNLKKIKKKKALELIGERVLDIEDFRLACQEAESIYNLMQDKRVSPESGEQVVCSADATRVQVRFGEHDGPIPVPELERIKSRGMRRTVRREFRNSLEYFREVIESLARERSIRERSYIRRTEDIFEEKLKQEPLDSTGQNGPELEGSFRTDTAPEAFVCLDSSMSDAQSLAARGLEGLIVNLRGRSEQSSSVVEGQFRGLGGRSVEEMGFKPAGLAHLRELTVQAASALRAMHPSGAAAASLALLALGDLLCGRVLRDTGAGERTVDSKAEFSGGSQNQTFSRREVRIYVEGKRMSGPLDLELTLSRAGMHRSLRTAYANLMQ